ncbi:MAG: protein kinase [Aeromicrobium sp.]
MLADRYELGDEIGRGGMGSVWRGRDTLLNRDVAIKQIGMIGAGEADLGRAEREAHLAARVTHRNVVAVYDFVEGDGHQWLVMEYVEGTTLAGLIAEQGALDPERLALLVQQVAGALAAAHAHGIVHRDVKPSNILLNRLGIAKLSDFGIARAQADAALTQTGLVTGSPAYLSPEVATGRTATIASDVWSLGATVFHAATGRPPYEVGDNLLGAMYRIVHDQPPTLHVEGPLAPLVAAMMQHDPAARPTMLEIEEALEVATTPAIGYFGGDEEEPEGYKAFARPTEVVEPTATTAFRPLTEPIDPPRDAPTAVAPTAVSPTPEPEPSTTEAPTAVAPTPPPVAPTTVAAAPPETPTTVSPTPRRAAPRRNPTPLVLGGLLAASVVVIAFLLMSRGGDDPTDEPRASAGPSATPTPEAEEAADEPGTTAEAMQGFAADYLQTASSDPESGFQMLTAGFQEQSGGFEGYSGFWDGVSEVDVDSIEADPDAMTVSYRYSYSYEGERRSDDITLQLEETDDGFLIAGEA